MIVVIFEVTPYLGQRKAYLDWAARLRPQLQKIDGFMAIERFESLTLPGKILSLAFLSRLHDFLTIFGNHRASCISPA